MGRQHGDDLGNVLSASLRRAARRLGWGVADQALSSLTNLGLGIVVARTVSPHDFGVFSLGLATYLLCLGVCRGLNAEPFMVRYSDVSRERWRRGASWATGSALLVGLVAGAVSLAAGLVGGAGGAAFVALGITLPGLLLQDTWRYCLVAEGRGRLAFLNDLLWVSMMFPAFAVELSRGSPSVAVLLFTWGSSGSLAGLAAAGLERTVPRLPMAVAWVQEQRDLAFRYVAEFAAANGALQATMYLVAALAGLAAAGSLRAGLIVLGPVLVIFQGIRLVFVPEGVRLLRRSTAAFRRAIVALSLILAGIALAWGSLILLLPARVGRTVLGGSWAGAHRLIVPLTLMLVASGAELAAVVGLRSMAAARNSLRARMIEGCLTLLAGTIGAVSRSAVVTAWALALAYALEVGVWWRAFSIALNARPRAAEPSIGPDVPAELPEARLEGVSIDPV